MTWDLWWVGAECLTGNLQAVGIWLHQLSHLDWSQGLRRNSVALFLLYWLVAIFLLLFNHVIFVFFF